MLKEQLGLAPTEVRENVFTPSPTSIALMRKVGSGYKHRDFTTTYTGSKKILVICTEEDLLETGNGKYFLTGTHPVEMLVPLLHICNAGFGFDIATLAGRPVKLEEWAIPPDDADIAAMLERTADQRARPLKLADAIVRLKAGDYAGIFIPGGHGAVLGLPSDRDVGTALEFAHRNGLTIMSLCHGPAAFLAAADGTSGGSFLFKGYTIAAFPDYIDRQLPKVGYLPGPMPWLFGQRLEALGLHIVGSLGTGKTHVDRNLVTGDGPLAANELGQLAADALLKQEQG